MYLKMQLQSPLFAKPTARLTAGFRCAPETDAKLYIDTMPVMPTTSGFHEGEATETGSAVGTCVAEAGAFGATLPISIAFQAKANSMHPTNSAM
jgi:hypothetical protein